ncbi:uncharacterized protein LOC120323852 [Pipra filicauda]|uniref:Uncharacterized protein LOC120323852 n=1 Tax=Pipra filicauda TaxID=649802 RepID=A0A7R5KV20_9PASS|nr:uncharacterized protein LOC120323852 [Pipra filicauda]
MTSQKVCSCPCDPAWKSSITSCPSSQSLRDVRDPGASAIKGHENRGPCQAKPSSLSLSEFVRVFPPKFPPCKGDTGSAILHHVSWQSSVAQTHPQLRFPARTRGGCRGSLSATPDAVRPLSCSLLRTRLPCSDTGPAELGLGSHNTGRGGGGGGRERKTELKTLEGWLSKIPGGTTGNPWERGSRDGRARRCLMSRLGLYLGAGEQRVWETPELCRISAVCLFSSAEIRLPFQCSVQNFVGAECVSALWMVFHIIRLNVLKVKEKLF